MDKIFNFSRMQAMLPQDILAIAGGELGTVVSAFMTDPDKLRELQSHAESTLRELLGVPLNYKILFMTGGASAQFSAIPLNLLSEHKCADYVLTGFMSKNASLEAKKYGDIAVAASSAGAMPAYSVIPETQKSDFRPDADYVHICYNNSLYGTKFHYIPDTGNIPLVADMTSSLLSEPIDVMKFGLIYAGAQANIGLEGMTVVIVRDDLVGGARVDTPSVINYKTVAENNAIFGTLPVLNLYLASLTFDKLASLGGLSEMKRKNERKASLLYDYLDSQTYYTSPVSKKCRSMMNVVFMTSDANLDAKFVEEAEACGLLGLARDRSVGGMCASIYNSMSYEGVERLVAFMRKFAFENPKFTA
ncbi:MAG: 3-phosphoserine/phosphohydroxythreonine transaminase [Clostridia bacterium]|nr:3-phosphoserine/phosphohydroxythreonine transaminase [Clostridia bacterium]